MPKRNLMLDETMTVSEGRQLPGSPSGGARRDRTDDLMLAKHALSQLSYGPFQQDRQIGKGDLPQGSSLPMANGGPGKT